MKRSTGRVLGFASSSAQSVSLIQRPTLSSFGGRRYAGGGHHDLAPSKPGPVMNHNVWPNGYLWNQAPGYERPPESWEKITYGGTALCFVLVYIGVKYNPFTSPEEQAHNEVQRRRQIQKEGHVWPEDKHLDVVVTRGNIPPLYQEDGMYYQWFARRRFLRSELEELMNAPYPKTRRNL